MDKKEIKDHLNKQIRSCEEVILKNAGVIEHCKHLLTILEKKKEVPSKKQMDERPTDNCPTDKRPKVPADANGLKKL